RAVGLFRRRARQSLEEAALPGPVSSAVRSEGRRKAQASHVRVGTCVSGTRYAAPNDMGKCGARQGAPSFCRPGIVCSSSTGGSYGNKALTLISHKEHADAATTVRRNVSRSFESPSVSFLYLASIRSKTGVQAMPESSFFVSTPRTSRAAHPHTASLRSQELL